MLRAAWIAASLAVLCTALLWMLLNFAPLRSSRLGPFARGLVTPAAALAATRRDHPTASWPMFGGSPSRVRFVASRLRPPFRIAAVIPGESLIEMPPAVAKGRVVFGTHDGTVIAARTSDGTVVWTRELNGCIASSPACTEPPNGSKSPWHCASAPAKCLREAEVGTTLLPRGSAEGEAEDASYRLPSVVNRHG